MTAVLAAAVALVPGARAQAADITGAGATFPYPIYAKWAEAYKAKTGIGMNYQSIGSGGGIAQIKAKTVDFGASDMPLKPEDLQSAGLMQFPAIIGGVVPIVNLDGHRAGRAQADRAGARRHLSRQDQEVERQGDRGAQRRAEAARRADRRRAPLGRLRARRSSGPTICRRSATSGRPRSAAAPPSRGRKAWAARATKASPRTCSGSRARSATSNTRTPSATSMTLRVGAEQGRPVRAARRCDVPGRRRERRLEQRAGLLPDPDRPAGQDRVADHRRELHPDARQAGQAAERRRGAEVLRLVVPQRPEDGGRSSTTSRCRTRSPR